VRFLVDESLPIPLATAELGHDVSHVVTLGLASSPDETVFREAQSRGATIISRDMDFSSAERFPIGTHHGIVVIRFPTSIRIERLIKGTVDRLRGLTEDDIKRNIVVVEPDRTRIRRKQS
jgi:predicted nuclease of predicted toxin-antitoxin system